MKPESRPHFGISSLASKPEIPKWGRLSGFISYSNMLGVGRLPITGGLFLEDTSAGLLQSNATFPVTQDQRNTARARFRYQVLPRLWFSTAAEYGSGLPVELDNLSNL